MVHFGHIFWFVTLSFCARFDYFSINVSHILVRLTGYHVRSNWASDFVQQWSLYACYMPTTLPWFDTWSFWSLCASFCLDFGHFLTQTGPCLVSWVFDHSPSLIMSFMDCLGAWNCLDLKHGRFGHFVLHFVLILAISWPKPGRVWFLGFLIILLALLCHLWTA